MKISLIEYTQNADDLLIFSKKTRLTMSPDTYKQIKNMPADEKQKELDYVFKTIGSSLEFVNYTFMIEDVTRAFTHQLVRHRVGVSFAQQSQRTVDVSDFDYLATGECTKDDTNGQIYKETMNHISQQYKKLISNGVKSEDARGILPTNVMTNILMKINLRALSSLMEVRRCLRTQKEFRKVVTEMRKAILSIHPWAEPALDVYCAKTGSCQFKNYIGCPVKKTGMIRVDKVVRAGIKNTINKITGVE